MKKVIYCCDICDKQTDEVTEFKTTIPYIDEDEFYRTQHLKYDLCEACYNKLAKELFKVIKDFGLEVKE